MPDIATLEAVADALDAASAVLRQRIALIDVKPARRRAMTAVDRARALHLQLGTRQAQIIQVLDDAGSNGMSTGEISRAIDYDQPNVYITLRVLTGLDFVEKDETKNPHRYRITEKLMGA